MVISRKQRQDTPYFCLEEYIATEFTRLVSKTIPLRNSPYESKTMFPFFDGLIPEGWLLDIAEHHWKVDRRDRMGLVLCCCRDTIGAVSLKPENTSDL